MRLIKLVQGSAEWLAWRRLSIGGSDIAAIMGVCPYRTALDIYNEKMGIAVNAVNARMQRGKDYEEAARRIFHRWIDLPQGEYIPVCCESVDNPRFIASLDGYNAHNRTIVEIKVPGRNTLDQAAYGQSPLHYRYQMQWQMYVAECNMAYYACYDPDSLEFYVVIVHRDDAVIASLKMEAERFLESLDAKVPPKGKREVITNDYVEIKIMEINDIKQKIKDLEELKDILMEQLLQQIGYKSVECNGMTVDKVERSTVDYKQACLDHKLCLDKYRKPVTISWTIREKRSKE